MNITVIQLIVGALVLLAVGVCGGMLIAKRNPKTADSVQEITDKLAAAAKRMESK